MLFCADCFGAIYGATCFGCSQKIGGNELWVEANLKETQLTHVRVGQSVRFGIDAYPGLEWRGAVASISPWPS